VNQVNGNIIALQYIESTLSATDDNDIITINDNTAGTLSALAIGGGGNDQFYSNVSQLIQICGDSCTCTCHSCHTHPSSARRATVLSLTWLTLMCVSVRV
jgi:hypothetical protein